MSKLSQSIRVIKNIHNAKTNISFNIAPIDWKSFDDEIASCITDLSNTLTSIPYDYIDQNCIEES